MTTTKANLVISPSKAYKGLFTKMRDEKTSSPEFAFYSKRAMRILAEDAIAELPGTNTKIIATPTKSKFTGVEGPPLSDICAVSVVRAGDSLLEAVRECLPGASVGKILIQRKEDTVEKLPDLIYQKLPPGIENKVILLCDPMLATGGSAKKAVEVLLEAGVQEEKIVFANMICCPEGIDAMTKSYPNVKIVTACVDECLNEHKYIVPGLGDYGDRFFNTV